MIRLRTSLPSLSVPNKNSNEGGFRDPPTVDIGSNGANSVAPIAIIVHPKRILVPIRKLGLRTDFKYLERFKAVTLGCLNSVHVDRSKRNPHLLKG